VGRERGHSVRNLTSIAVRQAVGADSGSGYRRSLAPKEKERKQYTGHSISSHYSCGCNCNH